MRLRAFLLISAVIAVGLIAIYAISTLNSTKLNSEQDYRSMQQSSRRSEWIHNTDYGVELWIAWGEEHDSGIGRYRKIYAFMEDKYFNEKDLRRIFIRMAEDNPTYTSLRIDIFSSEDELAWQIDPRFNRLHGIPTQEELEHEQKPKNCFFARYSRISWPNGVQEERFAYTPDPTKKDLIEINLKS